MKIMVTCCIDFSNKDLEISFFVFKPTVVIVDHLIHEIKQFSSRAENFGCVGSSILNSIYEAVGMNEWKSKENKERK
jgi:hypothetical protein